MKNILKWFSALALLVMGAFVFVSCGDDDDDVPAPAPKTQVSDLESEIVGNSWYVVPQNTDKRVEITVMNFGQNGQGMIAEGKAKAENDWRIDYEEAQMTYALDGNHIKMNIQTGRGEVVYEGDVYVYTDGTAEVRIVEDGQNKTMALYRLAQGNTGRQVLEQLVAKKTNNGGDNGDEASVVGTWNITYCEEGSYVGATLTLNSNGTANFSPVKENLTYRKDKNQYGNTVIYIYNGSDLVSQIIISFVQKGNVMNGCFLDEEYDDYGITLTKSGYTVPSNNLLGRWEVTASTDGLPEVGEVMVFGDGNELYIEGDEDTIGYQLGEVNNNRATLSIILEEGTMPGTLTINNWQTATWTFNGATLSLRKL